MLRNKHLIALLGIGILPFMGFAQDKKDTPPANWFNLDYKRDGIMGISTEKAYELLKGKKPTPVVVAVIDGGVDVEHEDLKEVLWINKKDSNNDGKDDDGNGYIDDKYGWNFIGGASGENVNHDNLEVTRLIAKYEPKYISVLPSTPLSESERREFVAYQKMISDYTTKMDEAQFGETNYGRLKQELDNIVSAIGKDPKDITKADFDIFNAISDRQKMAVRIAKKELEKNSFEKFYADIKDADTYFGDQVKYHLNKDFNPRPIVGDNYENAMEQFYGNNDVKGPDADHGTHVAGIIGAKRDNGKGVNGVSDQVKIMAIRVVPNGDERDKDVANGIRYAVDNGAKIINMSFGKGYFYNKKVVDEAVKYAIEKDVLLVHAAGNDGKNVDISKNYPTKYFTDSLGAITGEATSWITVGATSWKLDGDLLAEFSNYGYKTVDVFAPGVAIHSTMPDSKYKDQQGTSMAAPVVSGLAALLRAYYPQLTAQETKDIILKSVTKVDQKVKINQDGSSKKVYLDEISTGGGIVNAYNAIVEANKYISNKK
ncbi:S8 family peptidase [Sphingobacterium pedocola]|uniref:Peptidase S8 n=1 Tax=Sphingobacterium pedocola TaxID=2082722 RepID=A0ABR9TCP3_9SPHI|nr:S8 family peptidase [Sphingobacterium pedocola]MBE8723123.1 peptidase S8 [Sphingobacterium pedocola]